MSDKIQGVKIESVDAWHINAEDDVLIRCAAQGRKDFVLAFPVDQLTHLLGSLLGAFGETQSRSVAGDGTLNALDARSCDVGISHDGGVVVSFQGESGARIPFVLNAESAAHLSQMLAQAVDAAQSRSPTSSRKH